MSEEIKIKFANNVKKKGAILKVVGVGGAGGNAINRMIEDGLKGVEFIAVNTDIQDLNSIKQPSKILQIGERTTQGLGAGSNSETGFQAALEDSTSISELIKGANMIFIASGMGGGTGTGASQVVADIATRLGILTVAVVTKPFEFEGSSRMEIAEEGIRKLTELVDAIIVIPNQKLFEINGGELPLKEAYRKADDVLIQAVRGISDIINNPGYQNVDFADVKATMSSRGMTLMGTGEAKGENRAQMAANMALTSPLLDNISISGAKGILYNITASSDFSLKEMGIISEIIKQNAAPDAKIKFGVVYDDKMEDLLRVTVIATGFNERASHRMHSNINSVTRRQNTPNKPIEKTQETFLTPTTKENDNYFIDSDVRGITDPKLYVNETNTPNLGHNPDDYEDPLDIPAFLRKGKKDGENNQIWSEDDRDKFSNKKY